MLKLSFDQYQRYKIISDIITILRLPPDSRVLDIGGWPGVALEFLSFKNVYLLDKKYFSAKNSIVGDGIALPFRDDSFSIVIGSDVYEHIPSQNRQTFVSEMNRVNNQYMILSSPFKDNEVESAEEIVNSFCKKVTGEENECLKEHKTNGLPDISEVLRWAKRNNLYYLVFPNGFLLNWLIMMILNHYILSLPEPWELWSSINDSYNRHFYSLDNREPPYRQVILFSKKRLPESLRRELLKFVFKQGQKKKYDLIDPVSKLISDLIQNHGLPGKGKYCLGSSIERLKTVIEDKQRLYEKDTEALRKLIEEKQCLYEKDTAVLKGLVEDREYQIRQRQLQVDVLKKTIEDKDALYEKDTSILQQVIDEKQRLYEQDTAVLKGLVEDREYQLRQRDLQINALKKVIEEKDALYKKDMGVFQQVVEEKEQRYLDDTAVLKTIIKECEERVGDLENKIRTIKGEIGELQKKIHERNERINRLILAVESIEKNLGYRITQRIKRLLKLRWRKTSHA